MVSWSRVQVASGVWAVDEINLNDDMIHNEVNKMRSSSRLAVGAKLTPSRYACPIVFTEHFSLQ
jgi:hypothetical protein